ncbi:hypothetical protein Ancab_008165 [Ancistrocladus abbreviatus]
MPALNEKALMLSPGITMPTHSALLSSIDCSRMQVSCCSIAVDQIPLSWIPELCFPNVSQYSTPTQTACGVG